MIIAKEILDWFKMPSWHPSCVGPIGSNQGGRGEDESGYFEAFGFSNCGESISFLLIK